MQKVWNGYHFRYTFCHVVCSTFNSNLINLSKFRNHWNNRIVKHMLNGLICFVQTFLDKHIHKEDPT